jgi:hypothetical protein
MGRPVKLDGVGEREKEASVLCAEWYFGADGMSLAG